MVNVQVGQHTFLIPSEESSCSQWQSYFDALKKRLGRDNARLVWLYTWEHVGSVSCTTRASFNDWAQGEQIDVSNAFTRNTANTLAVGENITGSIKGLTTLASVGTPIIIAGVVLLILFFAFQVARKGNMATMLNAHPMVRASKAAQLLT